EGSGRLTLELFNSLLGLAALREASVYGAYSGAGTLWTAGSPQGEGAFFGRFGFLRETGLRNCAREARVTASSRFIEGQGTEELTDGFPLTFYASEQEEGTWIRFDFDSPRSIKYLVLINAAPDGSGYLTKDLDILGEDAGGSSARIGGLKDNGRCVAVIPLEGSRRALTLAAVKPNLFDRHTRIGEAYLLAVEEE
ncbi:MAG: hypothetical protein ILO36_06505, partial [Abditibacteriota bacterium]|nr:hypothetical protein [Abditibacteriota bacterium]